MKKLILTAIVGASLLVPAAAMADTPRFQEQSGTLDVHVGHLTDPGSESTHTYPKVTVNPCDGTFEGVDGYGRWTQGGETINGKFENGKVTSFSATMWGGGYQWTYDSTIADPTWQGFDGYQRFSVDSIDLHVANSTNWKNHGQFVKAQADKDDAAHSCIGMPAVSAN